MPERAAAPPYAMPALPEHRLSCRRSLFFLLFDVYFLLACRRVLLLPDASR